MIAHEFTYGVIANSLAVLDSTGEAGALGEAYGDVFAVCVDIWKYGETANSWAIGEDVYIPSGAMRYVNYPPSGPDSNPDHYSEITGTDVHINSGVPSKMFFLLAKGGLHPNQPGINMTGIGITDAAKIWYKALSFMAHDTTFMNARLAMSYASNDLFGYTSFQSFQVLVAWGLCGVGDIYIPVDPRPLLINTGMEKGSNPWIINSGGGAVGYVQNGVAGDYHGGKGYMKLGGTAYGLSGSVGQAFNFSGGVDVANVTFWLRISSVDSTTVANDFLYVEVRNFDTNAWLGSVIAFDNTNQGTGYVFYGPFDLISYLGVAPILKLDFRVVSSANDATTFYLDDVKMNGYIYK